MRESPLEFPRVELSIGDSIRMDDQILTVLDISGDEVTFRVDAAEDFQFDGLETDGLESGDVVCHGEAENRLPPR